LSAIPRVRALTATAALVLLAALLGVGPTAAGAAARQTPVEPASLPGEMVRVLAGARLSDADLATTRAQTQEAHQAERAARSATTPSPGGPSTQSLGLSSTIQVTYSGFTPAAQAAFQRAVDAWAATVSSSVPITVAASFVDFGSPMILGGAGPSSLYTVSGAGCTTPPYPTAYYPVALRNALCGTDVDPARPDIVANFSSTANWYYGTDGVVPSGAYDFTTVVLHELGHGLGFLGSSWVDSTQGGFGLSAATAGSLRMPFDYLTESGAGTALTSMTSPSAALKTQFTSQDLWVDGNAIRAARGGNRVKLYAPDPYIPGSSFSHLDEATYGPTDPDALMTPVLNSGEVHTNPGPVAAAVLRDTGWPLSPGISGTVSQVGGSPAPGVTVAAYAVGAAAPAATAVTSSNGSYTLTGLPVGQWQLSFSDPADRWVTAWYGPSTTRAGSALVTTTTGDAVANLTVQWPGGSGYTPVTPTRILDTRSGPVPAGRSVGQPVGPGGSIDLTVRGTLVGGTVTVPPTATAVVLNVTATDVTAPSYVTVYPTGVTRPTASNLNMEAGETVPNLVTVKVGAGGQVRLSNAAGTTALVVDLMGYYAPGSGDPFTALNPSRLLDTRTGPVPAGRALGVPVGPGGFVDLPVRGALLGGQLAVPTNASAVVVNVTVTEATAPSFLTVYPSDVARPLASNLNMVAGQTVANLVVVKVGATGEVRLANALGSTHVIADIVGYFAPGALSTFVARAPIRVLDTRYGPVPTGRAVGSPLGPGGSVDLSLAGGGYLPADATAVVMNVTVTDVSASSFITAYPTGMSAPNVSNLNMVAGDTVPNLVTVRIGAGGKVTIANAFGTTAVVVDIVGYYRP
jgi:hypothetical protein